VALPEDGGGRLVGPQAVVDDDDDGAGLLLALIRHDLTGIHALRLDLGIGRAGKQLLVARLQCRFRVGWGVEEMHPPSKSPIRTAATDRAVMAASLFQERVRIEVSDLN